jgi:RNA polymerase sigma-70 factor (ECF subfamily)
MHDEHHIIQLLKSKDKEAISILYDQYSPALYGVVLRIVQAKAIAEDVMQDTFIKIWKNGPNYDKSKGRLFTWILNIARNTAIDKTRSAHYRGNGKIQSMDTTLDEKNTDFSHEMETDHIGVRKKVDTLEPKYRTIIDLIYFKGYTQREVAEHLKLPLGTVKSRVKIALRNLRNIFCEKSDQSKTSNPLNSR